ncbi:hypothetical protein DN748_14205 [Sinomicrobium soli]|nr:hypothetical protein DN748_14205 [Sinomicrobium sp. N-1-3-6]
MSFKNIPKYKNVKKHPIKRGFLIFCFPDLLFCGLFDKIGAHTGRSGEEKTGLPPGTIDIR